MKTKIEFKNQLWLRPKKHADVAVVVLALLIPLATQGGGVVSECIEANLRDAMSGGGLVTFACDGTITLGSTITNVTDTVPDGTGHQVTISGNNATGVFYNNSNVTFTVIKLTIAEGQGYRGPGIFNDVKKGAGIFNDGGTLNLTEAVIERNIVQGYNFPAPPDMRGEGGGVFNRAGVVNAVSSTFSNNSAVAAGLSPGQALGGAIRNESGVVRRQDCRFTRNSALGRAQLSALGGAIHNSATLIVEACVFDLNSAIGGNGNVYNDVVNGGAGSGGAICNAGTATVNSSIFHGKSASGGQGDDGKDGGPGGMGGDALGGAIYSSSNLMLHATLLGTNRAFGGAGGRGGDGWSFGAGGPGGGGGVGHGGALFVTGSASVINSTLGWNTGQGGAGDDGGSSGSLYAAGRGSSGGGGGDGSGGLYGSGDSLALLNSTIAFNAGYGGGSGRARSGSVYHGMGGDGGDGGRGGTGQGGARCDSGNGSVNNCTIAWNTGQGSAGSPGGDGFPGTVAGGNGGQGGRGGSGRGGLYGFNTALNVTNSTIAFNAGYSGAGGAGGAGGVSSPRPGQSGAAGLSGETVGGVQVSTVKLVNTLLATNTPGGNGAGTLADFGHNLSSDGSCAFTNLGSLNNTDPRLGPLGEFGGPTLTVPLLVGSPAIDAGDDAAAPLTDQRGRARPYSATSDIGAFESSPPYVFTGYFCGQNATDRITITLNSQTISVTSGSGFLFDGLSPGTYLLTVSSENFVVFSGSRSLTFGPDACNERFTTFQWNSVNLADLSSCVAHIIYAGTNGQTHRLLASSNLVSWFAIATNTVGMDNYAEVMDVGAVGQTSRFYRVVMP